MHIRRVHSDEEMKACLTIRRLVFIGEQGVPEADEMDDLDRVCVHFLALPDKHSGPQRALGTARLAFVDAQTAKAQRVAVVPEHRRRGVGEALMFAVEAEAARAGRNIVVLSAQMQAIPFYLTLGYEPWGEPFMDAGIEHRWMRKQLS